MRQGAHRLVGVVAGLVISCLVLAGAASGQVADGGQGFRTPWGDPDFQGIWNNNTITPLERPEYLADQGVYTEEEAATLQQQLTAEGRYIQELWSSH